MRLLPLSAPLVAAVLTLGLVGGGSVAAPVTETPLPPSLAPTTAAKGDRALVVAVGDIACPPSATTTKEKCKERRTARLTAAIDPDAVLVLGDLQYQSGSLSDFRDSYDKTWGELRPVTYPVPGNHEYRTEDAAGYYSYFKRRQPGPPGYYAFDLGTWRVYALNSNCGEIRCGAQYEWLLKDLARNPEDCSLFAMHHPRFSSGPDHGSNPRMKRFFWIAQSHDVEMILAGHDHHYERFRRLTADGERSKNGVVSFVAGTGGKSLYGLGETEDGSAHREATSFGVLRLALRPDRYRFAFKDIDGSTADSGRRSCR